MLSVWLQGLLLKQPERMCDDRFGSRQDHRGTAARAREYETFIMPNIAKLTIPRKQEVQRCQCQVLFVRCFHVCDVLTVAGLWMESKLLVQSRSNKAKSNACRDAKSASIARAFEKSRTFAGPWRRSQPLISLQNSKKAILGKELPSFLLFLLGRLRVFLSLSLVSQKPQVLMCQILLRSCLDSTRYTDHHGSKTWQLRSTLLWRNAAAVICINKPANKPNRSGID